MLAVIPVAGKATRFSGVYKEFLPIGNGAFALDHAFYTAKQFGADDYILISNPDKIHKHAEHMQLFGAEYVKHTQFMLQQDFNDMWGAIRVTLPYNDHCNMLVLPDTYWTVDSDSVWKTALSSTFDLIFGVFYTNTPEKFSVFFNDTIITKQKLPSAKYYAWGTVVWSGAVADYWERQEKKTPYSTYDDAFRDAMSRFRYTFFAINQYHDFASQEAYSTFILDK